MGVRVVFYFKDDVQNFWNERAQSFRSWFCIYADASREFNDGLDAKHWTGTSPDYRSWHFTVRVDADTEFFFALSEKDKLFLKGLFCEVQLRTTIQDSTI